MGASKSSEVKGHQKSNLCSERDTVYRELQLLDNGRSVVRRTQIMIVNQCSYPLVHCNHGDSCGYFFSDAQSAFQQSWKNHANTINPGQTGGMLHTQYAAQDLFGTSGYVSFMVPTEGKNYIVCCGFYNSSLSNTSAGVEIRGLAFCFVLIYI